MIKINSYRIEMVDNLHGNLYITKNGEESLLTAIDISDKKWIHTAADLDEFARDLLNQHDYVVTNSVDLIVDPSEYGKEERADLRLVRRVMKDTLKELANKDISLEEKQRKIEIYAAMCSSAKMIIDSCKLELAYDKLTPGQIIEIK